MGLGTRLKRAGLAVLALAAAWAAVGPAGADDNKDHPTPSGLPVPRYVSLKFDSVNARAGPSDDHRLLWVFHAKGLPVQVIAETADWRRICDPDGQVSWVHRRTTDGRRMVMRTEPGPVPILASPKPNASVIAYLAPRALAAMDRCQNGWCKIKVGSVGGWAPANALSVLLTRRNAVEGAKAGVIVVPTPGVRHDDVDQVPV